jgi:molybdenum cofactor cytidylyltransferase
MRATVERGLAWVEERLHPQPEAFLLAPADHPALDASAVRALCDSFHSDPSHSILVPVHGGRRGHPALVAWRHVAGIRALAADRGINAYFREHANELREVSAAGPGVLCDLDTPEDYDRLRETWEAERGS